MKPLIGVSPFGASRDGVLNLAKQTAEAGLDGLILGDGFVSTPSFPIWSGGVDCFVELAWLAGQVELPTYGIDAVVLPARDPRILAKQICSLSAVTGGRCHVALSAGFWAEDAQLFGYSFPTRGARLDEGIRALQAALQGENFGGQFWSWETSLPISPCHGVPAPELWLSGAEATMHRALRYGLAWQPTRMSPRRWTENSHQDVGVGAGVQSRGVPDLHYAGRAARIPRRTARSVCRPRRNVRFNRTGL